MAFAEILGMTLSRWDEELIAIHILEGRDPCYAMFGKAEREKLYEAFLVLSSLPPEWQRQLASEVLDGRTL